MWRGLGFDPGDGGHWDLKGAHFPTKFLSQNVGREFDSFNKLDFKIKHTKDSFPSKNISVDARFFTSFSKTCLAALQSILIRFHDLINQF